MPPWLPVFDVECKFWGWGQIWKESPVTLVGVYSWLARLICIVFVKSHARSVESNLNEVFHLSVNYWARTLFAVLHYEMWYQGLKTQCKIEFTYVSHCVSKNLIPCRMLKTSFLIAQIIGWKNSFQNMYDMLMQNGPFGQENLFCPKKNT